MIIDRSAWYGFFFQSSEIHGDSTTEASLIIQSPLSSNNNGNSSNDEQKQQSLTPSSSFVPTHTKHELPFKVQGIPLNSLHYGQIIYFAKESVVKVIVNSKTCASAPSPLPVSPFRSSWRIICGPWATLDQNGALYGTVMSQQQKDATSPRMPKSIMCAICRRTFDSVKSIQQHQTHVHRQQLQHQQTSSSTKMADSSIIPSVSSSIWNQPLKVCYQDGDLAVIVKPQGMPVMGCPREKQQQHQQQQQPKTLMRSDLLMQLVHRQQQQQQEGTSAEQGKVFRKPVPVHRLDAATGGLLMVAMAKSMDSKLRNLFMNRQCQKRYRALVFGRLDQDHDETCTTSEKDKNVLTIAKPIGGKQAETRVQIVGHYPSVDPMAIGGWITLVDVFPMTGRKHQIRKHLRHIGHAIWGDVRYGRYNKKDESKNEAREKGQDNTTRANLETCSMEMVQQNPHARLCLYAMELTFPHPRTNETINVQMDEPKWLQQLLAFQKQEWEKAQKQHQTNDEP